jgi:alkylation response protein AidB-like acyl-CoA dehydrogenase
VVAQARLFSDLLELAAIPAPTGDEEARIDWLAWRTQNDESPVREISIAKLGAARIAVEVADECIQIHGGAGYMQEYGIERSWRDLRLNRIGAGTDEIMLDVIGRSYGL